LLLRRDVRLRAIALLLWRNVRLRWISPLLGRMLWRSLLRWLLPGLLGRSVALLLGVPAWLLRSRRRWMLPVAGLVRIIASRNLSVGLLRRICRLLTVGGGLLRISRLPLLRIAPLRLKGLLRRPRRLFFTPHYHETDHAPYDYEAYQSHCQEDQHTAHIRPLLSFRLSLFAFADQPRHLRMLRIEPLYLAELLDRFRIMRV